MNKITAFFSTLFHNFMSIFTSPDNAVLEQTAIIIGVAETLKAHPDLQPSFIMGTQMFIGMVDGGGIPSVDAAQTFILDKVKTAITDPVEEPAVMALAQMIISKVKLSLPPTPDVPTQMKQLRTVAVWVNNAAGGKSI